MIELIFLIAIPVLLFSGLGFACWHSDPKRPWMQQMSRRRMHQRLIEIYGIEHADEVYPEFVISK